MSTSSVSSRSTAAARTIPTICFRTSAAGNCAGKTGTLDGVSALSGYCDAGRRTIVFSLLMNSVDVDAARRYDTPGTGMFAPEVLGPTVDRLAELAGDGRALEFAIGTGRVAIPLAERGVAVTGIGTFPSDDPTTAHEG